jgi:hypothetical protein
MSDGILHKPEPGPFAIEKEEPLTLSEPGPSIKPAGMRAFGSVVAKPEHKVDYKRPLNADGTGATRCRLFCSKVAYSSLQHMEQQINEWLDAEKIEIKHVGHVVGVLEGKTQEPNVIVLAWY